MFIIGNIRFISDCHFGHRNAATKIDGRGFETLEDMHEYMITQWNKTVKDDDLVYILGDFYFGKDIELVSNILSQLKGRKVLIKGNHDHFVDKPLFNKDKYFEEVTDFKILQLENKTIIIMHYPLICYPYQYSSRTEAYMLYGHVHSTKDQLFVDDAVRSERVNGVKSNIYNVYCRYSDYKPLLLEEWIEINEDRIKENSC